MDFKLPSFINEDAETYFCLVDATFETYEMDDEPKKFLLTMAALTPELRVVAKKIIRLRPRTTL